MAEPTATGSTPGKYDQMLDAQQYGDFDEIARHMLQFADDYAATQEPEGTLSTLGMLNAMMRKFAKPQGRAEGVLRRLLESAEVQEDAARADAGLFPSPVVLYSTLEQAVGPRRDLLLDEKWHARLRDDLKAQLPSGPVSKAPPGDPHSEREALTPQQAYERVWGNLKTQLPSGLVSGAPPDDPHAERGAPTPQQVYERVWGNRADAEPHTSLRQQLFPASRGAGGAAASDTTAGAEAGPSQVQPKLQVSDADAKNRVIVEGSNAWLDQYLPDLTGPWESSPPAPRIPHVSNVGVANQVIDQLVARLHRVQLQLHRARNEQQRQQAPRGARAGHHRRGKS